MSILLQISAYSLGGIYKDSILRGVQPSRSSIYLVIFIFSFLIYLLP